MLVTAMNLYFQNLYIKIFWKRLELVRVRRWMHLFIIVVVVVVVVVIIIIIIIIIIVMFYQIFLRYTRALDER